MDGGDTQQGSAKVLDLTGARRPVAAVPNDLESSGKSIYTWRRQPAPHGRLRGDRHAPPDTGQCPTAGLHTAVADVVELRRSSRPGSR